MKNLGILKIAILGLGLLSGSVTGQKISSNNVKTVVAGTSTLHDWKMTSTGGSFSGTLSGNSIQDVRYTMAGKTLKSGKGAMDNNAYKALGTTQFPNITFSATSVNIGKGTITGKLTVTKVTKNVTFPVNVTKNGNAYTIWGNTAIKMSDYGVTPPSFMMNTVKTGDAITITVNAVTN